jgi:hypothetical protein
MIYQRMMIAWMVIRLGDLRHPRELESKDKILSQMKANYNSILHIKINS